MEKDKYLEERICEKGEEMYNCKECLFDILCNKDGEASADIEEPVITVSSI